MNHADILAQNEQSRKSNHIAPFGRTYRHADSARAADASLPVMCWA